ncbi:transmembrane emp24 domain-containing protein p24delta9-like [Vicia villosa]|uniref:transmembrane emp24 domain-containing protein p24delta9-like n=1 Tax=Vicia villosa TaxID=3911 RepID=UPI00273A89C6|nr:transmembrane emp24 domain-containing protein p24delta9-like [Vicia villosa]
MADYECRATNEAHIRFSRLKELYENHLVAAAETEEEGDGLFVEYHRGCALRFGSSLTSTASTTMIPLTLTPCPRTNNPLYKLCKLHPPYNLFFFTISPLINMVELQSQLHFLFLLVLSIKLFSCSVECMRFDLPPGLARCLGEDVKKNSLTVGNYSIVNHNPGHPLPVNHTILVTVTSNKGTVSHHYADHVQSGQFAIQAHESSDYLVCVWDTTNDPQVSLTIDLDWRTGVAAKDWSYIAKKTNIDKMTFEVQKMQQAALSIMEDMTYLLERNTEMLVLNRITDNRMLLLIFVSLLVSFSVAGLQLWHLKTFFKKNKLL